MTDQALINKFLDGDVAAFNTLVWRWEKPIFNFAYRYVGGVETAKEATQQTFIRAYKNLHRLNDTARFSTWLHQITLNICRDELKRQKRIFVSVEGLQSDTESGSSLPRELWDTPGDRPDSNTHNAQLADILKRALRSLPEEQRVVVVMKQYQGLKFSEIADILKEPINTVKSRMYYGLSALRRILKEWDIDQEAIGYEV
jgi:RNA polymerase sigma-70 factor (ECF subfamily)